MANGSRNESATDFRKSSEPSETSYIVTKRFTQEDGGDGDGGISAGENFYYENYFLFFIFS